MIFAVYIPYVINTLAACWCIYTDHSVWASAFFILALITLPTVESERKK